MIILKSNIQLELGKVATPFEHRSYGEELALCQRYYNRIESLDSDNTWFTSGFSYSTVYAHGVIQFPVPMRDVPSLKHTNTATDYKVWHGANVNTICNSVPSADGVNLSTARIAFPVASGLTVGSPCLFRANATGSFLAFDAEL